MKSTSAHSQESEIVIGKTTYTVTTHYSENARETAADKLLRYVSDRISEESNGKGEG
jgi:hypothetical protein